MYADAKWYSWLLYRPESSYIRMTVLILVQGAGPLSLDRTLLRSLPVR